MRPTESFDDRTPPPRDVERRAAEWVLRVQEGLSARESREFDCWLQHDKRNAAIFAELNETSRLLDRLRDPVLARHEAPSGIASSPQSRGDIPLPSRKIIRIAAIAWGAAAAIMLVWVVGPRPTAQTYIEIVASEVGSVRQVDLPDGSRVHLNTDSAIEVGYKADERRVKLLRGEAYFVVVKNPNRPFWVDAGTVAVRAVGTAFNVRYRAETVEVLVREGKVSVNQTRAAPDIALQPEPSLAPQRSFDPRLLVAGEKAVIATISSSVKPISPIVVAVVALPRIESTLAWQTGRLEFTDTPLSEVVAEFNRYNRHKLVIDDPLLAKQTFGGAFASTGYNSLVDVLEQSFRVVAERRAGETILRLAQ